QYKCRLGLGPTTRAAHHYLLNEALRFAVGPRPNLHQNCIQPRPSILQSEKVANVLRQQLMISMAPLFKGGALIFNINVGWALAQQRAQRTITY
ncbi:MAG: hypothetical protein KBB94_09435, partial [Legionellaceae bacterium]|nr:hypothetical protein [Legionellaceae bacterium]